MGRTLIGAVFEKTLEYLAQMPKAKRKAIGQFFTSIETAQYMVSMFKQPQKSHLTILDPGAGTGILTAAAIDRLQTNPFVKEIRITCYETSPEVLPVLKNNLIFLKTNSSIPINYEIIEENYITTQSAAFQSGICSLRYDWVISNPPYKKLAKTADEATGMPTVCYGAPNLYFLFTAMGLFNLSPVGEMVFIIPRSWTSGAYFKKFRRYIFEQGSLERIHLFVSRDKVFEKENVLQETMIIKMVKTESCRPVKITCSNSNSDFNNITTIEVPHNAIVVGEDKYVYLPTTKDDLNILQRLAKWQNTLLSIGLKMRTGLTVDYRCREYLRNAPETGAVPLLYAHHIKCGRIEFPIRRECEYITTEKAGLTQKNKNYLLLKRFTSKEEPKRFQCGIYLAVDLPEYSRISTHNKVNFIEGCGFDLTKEQTYGLYVLFNSSLYDQYYRILDGSTQVNSTEVNSMPVPSLLEIEQLGVQLMKTNDLSVEYCNILLGRLLDG